MQVTVLSYVSVIGCGQECSGMPKVFKNNEQLISPEILRQV